MIEYEISSGTQTVIVSSCLVYHEAQRQCDRRQLGQSGEMAEESRTDELRHADVEC
jgi:hypothetical protein